jgi:hypothetical protein
VNSIKQFTYCLRTLIEFTPVIPFFTFRELKSWNIHTCTGSDYCVCNFDSGRNCYPACYIESTPLTRFIERNRVASMQGSPL